MGKFTFEYYRDMLNNALMMGYKITSMKDYKKVYDKHILIRHDLDFTLENVPIFSTIENELGISGTYFVRINAKNYNPFSHNNSKIIKSLIEKNHEIGLHIEPDYYKNMDLEYVDYINVLINLFEKTFKIEIKGISTHEPARCGYIIDKKKYNKNKSRI